MDVPSTVHGVQSSTIPYRAGLVPACLSVCVPVLPFQHGLYNLSYMKVFPEISLSACLSVPAWGSR